MEEELIELVKGNRFLYDKSHQSYKNIYLRNKKFEELAAILGETSTKIKEKWRSLRNKYVREKKKLLQPSGSAAAYTKPWKYKEAMSFLDDVDNVNHSTTSNFDSTMEEEDNILSCSINQVLSDEVTHFEENLSQPPKRKKHGEASALTKAQQELAQVVLTAQESLNAPVVQLTAAQSFLNSIATQVDSLNLSAADFTSFQMDVLECLKKAINKSTN